MILFLFFLLPSLVQILCYTILHYPGDQVQRHRLIQRELHGALALFVLGEFFLESLVPSGSSIETQVVFKRRKVDQGTVKSVRGHAIGHTLFGTGSGLFDRVAHLLQQGLYVARKSGYILVNGSRLECGHTNVFEVDGYGIVIQRSLTEEGMLLEAAVRVPVVLLMY